MKKNMIKWLLPFILFVVGCSDDDGKIEVGLGLDITETDIIIPASGNLTANTILSSTVDWTISGESDWCTYSPKNGVAGEATFIEFTANTTNESYDERVMLLELQAGTKKQVISVTQKQKNAILFSKSRNEVPQEGGYVQLIIGANVEYNITIPDQFTGWVKASGAPAKTPSSRGLDTLQTNWFYVDANPDAEGRTGYLFVNGPNRYVDTAWIYQYQQDRLMLNQRNVKVPYDRETPLTVVLRANVLWDAYTSDQWITIEKVSTDDNKAFLKIASSGGVDRVGKVIFKDRNSSLSDTLTIDQRKLLYVSFDENSQEKNVAKTEGPLTLTVGHNHPDSFYLVLPKVEAKWIKIDGATEEPDGSLRVPATLGTPAGDGKSNFTFTVLENPEGDIARSGKVVVRTMESEEQETVYDTAYVYQAGRPLHSELAVLDTIYKRWGSGSGSGWNNRPDWTPANRSLVRTGVVTALFGENNEEHIVELDLGFAPPTGSVIPAEIADLQYLKVLKIGTAEIGYYSGIGTTTVGTLVGEVPASLGKLKDLKKLFIGGKITSIPEELGELLNLEELELYTVAGNSDMAWIGRLKSLTKLGLFNSWSGPMPESFGNLTELTYLQLGGRNLNYVTGYTEIPESFGNLSKLKYLSIISEAPTLPKTVGSFTDLEIFESYTSQARDSLVTSSGFTSFPDEIASWSKLKEFRSYYNLLTKMPSGIAGMEALEKLEIVGAPEMAGTLPSMDLLTKLVRLNISNTKLTGDIPEGITNNKEMTFIDLSNNRLTGVIPEEIGNLEKLTTFKLNSNYSFDGDKTYTGLSGSIPASIGKLVLLTQLNLNNNRLEGTIPPEVAEMEALTYMYLNDNKLNGIVTGALFGMNKVAKMELQNNQFDYLPSEIENISREGEGGGGKIIYLNNNKIKNFPEEIGKIVSKIDELNLADNEISGVLPPSLTLDFLHGKNGKIDVRGNMLQGDLPAELAKTLGTLVGGKWTNYQNVYLNPQQTGYGIKNVPNQER